MQNSQQGLFLVEFVIRFVRKKIEFVIRLLGLYKTKKNCDVIKFIQTIRKKERVHPDFQRAEMSNHLKTGPFQVSGNLFRANHWSWNSWAERFKLWVSQELVATWNHRYSDLFVECHKTVSTCHSYATSSPRLPPLQASSTVLTNHVLHTTTAPISVRKEIDVRGNGSGFRMRELITSWGPC